MKNYSIVFKNVYRRLPKDFYQEINPRPVKNPSIKYWNEPLAQSLGLNFTINSDRNFLEQTFSGNQIVQNSQPLAMAYSGHQFGHFNPNLGDGRAHLLGELENNKGQIYDIQLKGSGRTQYSRRGDGLSPLGPVVRECIVSEAMYFLGIPTTRCLALVCTNENVYREQALKGGVLTRVAESFVRVGHFEYLAFHKKSEFVKLLVNYIIQRSYPELKNSTDPCFDFFKALVKRQAKLIAQWMGLGFVHGVMNTDNTSACGLSLDFGPCAFLDETNFSQVYSSIDKDGRYAYDNQPSIILWNLTRLAECLLMSYDSDKIIHIKPLFQQQLFDFEILFRDFWTQVFYKKIGFSIPPKNDQKNVLNRILEYFQDYKIDFTNGFRNLKTLLSETKTESLFKENEILEIIISDWKMLLHQNNSSENAITVMDSVNPTMIPRNHILEKIIQDCYNDDYEGFYKLMEQLKTPFANKPENDEFSLPPNDSEKIKKTFCGT